MKLYYFTGACALSPHIVLMELGLPFDAIKVDHLHKTLPDGSDFFQVNSKGAVPALLLDNGQVLTEGPAIVQYLADLKPEANLAPRWGTFERYRLIEMLNFITSEVHKSISPLFDPAAVPEWQAAALTTLKRRFDWLASDLGGKSFLLGEQFTVADAYLFTVLGWTKPLKIDLSPWPVLARYRLRILARPAVHAAMRAEGLVQ